MGVKGRFRVRVRVQGSGFKVRVRLYSKDPTPSNTDRHTHPYTLFRAQLWTTSESRAQQYTIGKALTSAFQRYTARLSTPRWSQLMPKTVWFGCVSCDTTYYRPPSSLTPLPPPNSNHTLTHPCTSSPPPSEPLPPPYTRHPSSPHSSRTLFWVFRFAPAWTSTSTQLTWPFIAAQISAVSPS